ncbi:MAG: hypothetical protein ACI9SQ_000528, partial [Rubritalea sp.]
EPLVLVCVHLSSFHGLSEPNRIFCLNTAQVNKFNDQLLK